MKTKLMMMVAVVFAQFAFAESAVVDGVTWYYSTFTERVDGQSGTYDQITSGADKYSGNLTVPAALAYIKFVKAEVLP